MTRDEAIEIVFQHGPGGQSKIACTAWIDLFQYLGMLKLDEPPSREALIHRAGWWTRIGGAVEVSPESMAKAIKLIGEMKSFLKSELSR